MEKSRPVKPPLIAIGCDVAPGPPPAALLRLEYCDAVSGAGGVPFLLPPYADAAAARLALEAADALVLSGGPDYDPGAYGQAAHPASSPVHPRRQGGDLLLARRALRAGLPLLGICGGLQLLNIALGGDLIQDIPDQVPGAGVHRGPPGGDPAAPHTVRVLPGTLLDRLVGRSEIEVNSFHHQAVGRLGRGLRVAAVAGDGVVEAVEGKAAGKGARFCLGVQWHPERDAAAFNRSIFEGLVEAARAARRGYRA